MTGQAAQCSRRVGHREHLEVRLWCGGEQRRRLTERFHRDLKVQPKEITVTSVDEALLQNVIRIVDENMANDEFDTATLAVIMRTKRKLWRSD